MFRYSYKVELKRYESKKFGLLATLAMSDDTRAQKELEMVNKQIDWLKEQIAKGLDPGAITL